MKNGYREMEIYQRAYKGALAIYQMTERFPEEEKYGITSQMRRASMSIALNIAEGYAKRESQQEFKRFLMMAIGSANEMEVLTDFAKDFGYTDEETHRKAREDYETIGRMLNRLIKRVSENIK